jgi:hypothetical protein
MRASAALLPIPCGVRQQARSRHPGSDGRACGDPIRRLGSRQRSNLRMTGAG